MSTAPESVLREFGASAGIDQLSFSARGHVNLQLELGRRINIEQAGTEVLISMAQPTPYDAADRLLRAWKLAHHTRQSGHAVQAALQETAEGTYLLALLRVPAEAFNVSRLQRSIEYLSGWLDTVNREH